MAELPGYRFRWTRRFPFSLRVSRLPAADHARRKRQAGIEPYGGLQMPKLGVLASLFPLSSLKFPNERPIFRPVLSGP